MKFKHNTLILLAGILWLMIGMTLLSLGMFFLLETIRSPELSLIGGKFSLVNFFGIYISDRTHVVILIVTKALLLGHLKGKMVLAKSVNRQIKRIETLPNPSPLRYLYSKGYYLLVGCMVCLGMSMKFLPITLDTLGAIDITIGSALINGAMLYFRSLAHKIYLKKHHSKKS